MSKMEYMEKQPVKFKKRQQYVIRAKHFHEKDKRQH